MAREVIRPLIIYIRNCIGSGYHDDAENGLNVLADTIKQVPDDIPFAAERLIDLFYYRTGFLSVTPKEVLSSMWKIITRGWLATDDRCLEELFAKTISNYSQHRDLPAVSEFRIALEMRKEDIPSEKLKRFIADADLKTNDGLENLSVAVAAHAWIRSADVATLKKLFGAT